MAIEGSDRDPAKTCNTDGCNAWATKQSDRTRCRNCGGESTGPKTEEGKKAVRSNRMTHGLHQSAELFFEDADQSHLDTYHATFEALCRRYENVHGEEPMHYAKEQLEEVAFEMAKLNMAREYQKEHAVDESKPLTERQLKDIGGDPVEVEAVSKVESLKTDIRRENRLLLKDMGIYSSPEKQQAEATEALSVILSEED